MGLIGCRSGWGPHSGSRRHWVCRRTL